MWETMYASSGVGLAAPQVNRSIRLFVVDTLQMFRNMDEEEKAEYPGDSGIKETFINAKLKELNGEEWPYNEGCLSIPKIREDIYRQETVTIQYSDTQFQEHTAAFTGITARVILFELDPIAVDLVSCVDVVMIRRLMQGQLNDTHKGKVAVDYKVIFPG